MRVISKTDAAGVRNRNDRDILESVPESGLVVLLGTLEPLSVPFPDVDEDLPPLRDVTF